MQTATQGSKSEIGAFFMASFLSLLAGNAITSYGLVVLSHALSGSNVFAGSVFLVNVLPILILTPLAGAWLDRYPRRPLLLAAHALQLAAAAALAGGLALGLVYAGNRSPLLVIAAFNGLALVIVQPGRYALLGQLVSAATLARATSVLNFLMIVGFAGAPALVGVIRARYPWSTVFAAIAMLFLISIACLLYVPARSGLNTQQSSLHALAKGLRFAKNDLSVRHLLMFSVIAMLPLGPVQVLVPEFLRSTLYLGEQGRGVLMAAMGAGLLVGGATAAALSSERVRGWVVISATLIGSLALLALGPQRLPLTVALTLGAIGISGGLVASLVPATLQTWTPDHFRGRIMSLYSVAFQGTPALAGVMAGYGADRWGVAHALSAVGGMMLVAACITGAGLSRIRVWLHGEA